LNRARDDVLIAYEMNGAPLRPENGYPVRLIVPGYYGTNSVKWLVQLVLAETRAIGPFTTRWYNDAVQDVSERQIGTRPVWSIAPESIIVSPAPDDALSVGALVEVWGWAWADSGVAGVDISADNGQSWMAAAVEPAAGHAWQRFSLAWRPDQHIACALWSRARTADGRSQPISGARNEIYPVPVKLTAKP
jgi:DMSO/TMAO reductase YedYZ molybdopterin-dependent catalytic subunit